MVPLAAAAEARRAEEPEHARARLFDAFSQVSAADARREADADVLRVQHPIGRLGDRLGHHVPVVERRDVAELAVGDQVDRAHAEAGAQLAVERARAAAALHVAQHRRAHLVLRERRELGGEPLARSTQPALPKPAFWLPP